MGTIAAEYMDGSIARIRRDGTELETLAGRQPQPSVMVMAGQRLFWVNVGRGDVRPAIMSLIVDPSRTTTAAPIAGIGPDQPLSLAVDSTHLYWTIRGSGATGQVQAFDIAAGETSVIASGQETPWGIAVDADAVYWTTQGSSFASPGNLMRVTKPTRARPPSR
jgi:hypothetical protein